MILKSVPLFFSFFLSFFSPAEVHLFAQANTHTRLFPSTDKKNPFRTNEVILKFFAEKMQTEHIKEHFSLLSSAKCNWITCKLRMKALQTHAWQIIVTTPKYIYKYWMFTPVGSSNQLCCIECFIRNAGIWLPKYD